jgi:uncharacterized membrane protein
MLPIPGNSIAYLRGFRLAHEVLSKRGGRMKSLFLILLILTACNSYDPKNQGSGPNSAQMASPGLDTVQTFIFQPYCVRCHSSRGGEPHGVNLETYNNILLNLESIQTEAVVARTMPPRAPLPANLQQLLINWIANGAPLSGTNPAPRWTQRGNYEK